MEQPQRIFNSLGYVIKLKEAGFSEKQATVQAEMLLEVLNEQLLRKQDMHDMEMRLDGGMTRLSGEIKDVETRLSADIQKLDFKIADVETRLSGEIKNVETRLRAEIKEVKSDIKLSEHKIIIKLGTLMVVLCSLSIGVVTMLMKVIH